MKIKHFILSFILILLCPIAAHAETAVPTSAVVTVNGEPVNFCAYNIYGSNYFMLRDVAMALKDTEKKFNVEWKYDAIYLKNNYSYTPVGTELSQNAKLHQTAEISVPKITFGGSDPCITMVGYNIADSNYFKIRDIARFFDFSVDYKDGQLAIDTSKPYVPEMPYEPDGEVLGMAYEANFPLFINEMPIVSYYSSIDTAYNEEQKERINQNSLINGVYVSAENLDNYGFDKEYKNGDIYLTRNKDKKFGMMDGEIVNSAPSDVQEVYAAKVKVFLDGEEIRNISIKDTPYISVAELNKYGDALGRFETFNSVESKPIRYRVNIDFLKTELDKDIEETEMTYVVDQALGQYFDTTGASSPGELWFCDTLFKYHINFTHRFSYEDYLGYGFFENEKIKKNGLGILNDTDGYKIHNGHFERGIFENNELIDGIKQQASYLSAWLGPIVDGYRIEGARINGYKRECILPYETTENMRFGYRVTCEGEIKDGEYCGYYRQYDETGKLIYEGDYSKRPQEEQ